jgi:hypothetical protein
MTSVIKPDDIVCRKCAQVFTPGADHDPCIKNLPLVDFACCGHGDPNDDAYLCFMPTKVIAKKVTFGVFSIHRLVQRKEHLNVNNSPLMVNAKRIAPRPYIGLYGLVYDLSIMVSQDIFDELVLWMKSTTPPTSAQDILDSLMTKYAVAFDTEWTSSERYRECGDSE